MRIIVFTGRGGSGVSTIAAATATALANEGRPTLAFGLGSGLGNALGAPLTHEPSEVANALFALETGHGQDEPDDFRDWLEDLLDWRGIEAELAEDLAALPGANQVGRMLNLATHVQGGEYEAVVVDGLPLEQFLDLLPSLDAAACWLDRLFAPRQSNVFEPFVRMFAADYAEAGEDLLESGRELLGRLAELRDSLTDSEVCSVRVLVRPDGTAASDAREAITVLSLFSYASDALVVNQLLPDDVKDAFFDEMRSEQKNGVIEAALTAGEMPVLQAGLMAKSPRGLEALLQLSSGMYEDRMAGDVLYRMASHSFSQQSEGYVMTLALPFADKKDLAVEQMDDGVAVHLNGRRCVLALPSEIRNREATSWSFEPPTLKVVFKQ